MLNILKVIISKNAKKDLLKVPSHVVRKFESWVEAVEHEGLLEVRKTPGYHDEPLRGNRAGQRSIRLTKAYRAIYTVDSEGRIELIHVLEVNKHDY